MRWKFKKIFSQCKMNSIIKHSSAYDRKHLRNGHTRHEDVYRKNNTHIEVFLWGWITQVSKSISCRTLAPRKQFCQSWFNVRNGGTYQQSDTIAFEIQSHTDSVSRHLPLRDTVTLFHENNRSNCSNFSRHSSKSYNPNHSIDQDRYLPLSERRGHIQEQLSP